MVKKGCGRASDGERTSLILREWVWIGGRMAGMRSKETCKVAVLAGGSSSERDVSLQSGVNAQCALLEAGYGTVDLLDPADLTFIDDVRAYDVAFIALHGVGGEDGQIQHILEYLGVPYTGSDSFASACGMDKDVSKLIYAQAGIPIARGVALVAGRPYDIEEVISAVGEQSFVKPADNGSSYGISLVKDPSELADAIELAFKYADKILVKQRLVGTEITVGVLGDDEDLQALPIVEICCPEQTEFYDLSVKYVDPTDIHRIPARIPEKDYSLAQELACRAHRALGCFGFSRTDFIVTEDGPVILETNTIPGMTSASLFPDEVAHAGMSFADVCACLVDMALARSGR